MERVLRTRVRNREKLSDHSCESSDQIQVSESRVQGEYCYKVRCVKVRYKCGAFSVYSES